MEALDADLPLDPEPLLQWMWADAAALPLPGFRALAKANPLRWSAAMSATALEEDLQKYCDRDRPVEVRVEGEQRAHRFASPALAARWVAGAGSVDNEYRVTQRSASGLALGFAMRYLSASGLAVLLRLQPVDRPWTQRNVFAAYSYASFVCAFPHTVAARQRDDARFSHRHLAWAEWFASEDASLAALIEHVQCNNTDRPTTFMVHDRVYERYDSLAWSDFWAVFVCDAHALVLLRGGDADGRPGDMRVHPGSPVRAFVKDGDAERVPYECLPFAVLEQLGACGFRVTIVAYSQGAIPALACAHRFAHERWLHRIVLLNGALLFWPPWMAHISARDAGGDVPPPQGQQQACFAATSYVVEGDPLSHGIAGSFAAPRAVGETVLLPTCGDGFDNHYLRHFLRASPA